MPLRRNRAFEEKMLASLEAEFQKMAGQMIGELFGAVRQKLAETPAARTIPPSSAPPLDPYEVLGVTRQMSLADIEKVYHRKIRQVHPDTAGGNPEQARRLIAAMYLIRKEKQ